MSTNQNLNRPTPSLLSKAILKLRRRAANAKFEKARRISSKPLSEAFPDAAGVECKIACASALHAQLGNIDVRELVMISSICAYLNPATVFEFGTFDGRTTLHLALNVPAGGRVFTLDLAPNDPIRNSVTDDTFYTGGVEVGQHFRESKEASRIEQIWGNTLDYQHAPLSGRVDLVFVDAGHAYELVKSDGRKALDMIRPGGVVLWHDYSFGHPGVYTYLNELAMQIPLINLEWTSLVCYVKPI